MTVDYSKCCLELANGEVLTFTHDRFNNLPIASQVKHQYSFSHLTAPLIRPQVNAAWDAQETQNLTHAQQELLGWHWKGFNESRPIPDDKRSIFKDADSED